MDPVVRDQRNFRAIGLLIIIYGVLIVMGSFAMSLNPDMPKAGRILFGAVMGPLGVGQIVTGIALRQFARHAIWPAIVLCLPGPGLVFSLILLLRIGSYSRLVQTKSMAITA